MSCGLLFRRWAERSDFAFTTETQRSTEITEISLVSLWFILRALMRRLFVVLLLLAACQSSAPPAPAPTPEAAPAAQSTVFVTAGTLNVRKDPSANATVVTQVKR